METTFSTLLAEPPSYLSMVSMVGDDQGYTIQQLERAEQKSPPVYDPTRDLFVAQLEGKFSYQEALAQAELLSDETESKCARDVLRESRSFLSTESPARVGRLEPMAIRLPNAMPLNVSPVWLRHLPQKRLMVLHFWQKPLSLWQLSAAAGILIAGMQEDKPLLASLEIDFISVAKPEDRPKRQFQRFGWTDLDPLYGDELQRFLRRFCDAWEKYKKRGPRLIRLRHMQPNFLDKLSPEKGQKPV
jgi:hypothetical protein